VSGVDYAANMLRVAPERQSARAAERIAWLLGDGQKLPFDDAVFDAVTSGFVLRNFADLPTALNEMARVTRPGGRVVALEASPPSFGLWRRAVDLYFRVAVRALGLLIARDPGAYTYLGRSVGAFHGPSAMDQLLRAAGLTPLRPTRRLGGAVMIYVGLKP
jgi:demethylmenaquinone methyltransferase/2-methoxy-6-polyprenyl-1,4-benzoquinol methylase